MALRNKKIGADWHSVSVPVDAPREAAEIKRDRRQIQLITLSPLSVWVSVDKDMKDKHRLQWKVRPADGHPLCIDRLWPVTQCFSAATGEPPCQARRPVGILVQATNKEMQRQHYIRHMQVFTVLSVFVFVKTFLLLPIIGDHVILKAEFLQNLVGRRFHFVKTCLPGPVSGKWHQRKRQSN